MLKLDQVLILNFYRFTNLSGGLPCLLFQQEHLDVVKDGVESPLDGSAGHLQHDVHLLEGEHANISLTSLKYICSLH